MSVILLVDGLPGNYVGTAGRGQVTGNGHHLVNESKDEVVYLEAGDRTPGDEGSSYPDDDLKALMVDGKWKFVHKGGAAY